MSNTSNIQKVLAFDFGVKRIGAAYGQCITGSASPLPPLSAKDGIPNWQNLEQLISQWNPDLVLVGLPLNMDGTENEMCKRARKFANRIHGRLGKQIEMHDERLTSYEAKSRVIESGGDRDFGKNSVDGMAAVLLFESWYSSRKQPNNQQNN